jgi:chromosome segregation ATPase
MTTKFLALISVIGLATIYVVQAQSPAPTESPASSPSSAESPAASPKAKRTHKKAKATRKSKEQLAKERADIQQWLGDQPQNVQTLQARYQQLQQQEADLLSQIGAMQTLPDYVQGRSGRHYYSYKNPLRANLPLLQSHLSDVRREKAQVREQLEKTQH